jgi:hypothetical protein
MLTVAGLGAAYVAFWWLAPGTVAFAMAADRARVRRGPVDVDTPPSHGHLAWLVAAAALPGILVTAELAATLLNLSIPLVGRIASPLPLDPIVAIFFAAPVVLIVLAALPLIHLSSPRIPTLSVATCAAVAAMVVLSFHSPFTAQRPQRLSVLHEEGRGQPRVVIQSEDALPPPALTPGILAIAPFVPEGGRRQLAAAVEGTGLDLPVIKIRPHGPAVTDGGVRSVTVEIGPSSLDRLAIRVPKTALVAWSDAHSLPPLGATDEDYLLAWQPAPRATREVLLELRGAAPVEAVVEGTSRGHPSPLLSRLVDRFPNWATVAFTLIRSERRLF